LQYHTLVSKSIVYKIDLESVENSHHIVPNNKYTNYVL